MSDVDPPIGSLVGEQGPEPIVIDEAPNHAVVADAVLRSIRTLRVGPQTRLVVTIGDGYDALDADGAARLRDTLVAWSGIPADRILLLSGVDVTALEP